MRRPAELPDWPQFLEPEARINQYSGIARPTDRVATDVCHARSLARRNLNHLLPRARPGWIENQCPEPARLICLQRIAKQVTMKRVHRYLPPIRSRLAGEMRIARSLHCQHLPRPRQSKGERAEA